MAAKRLYRSAKDRMLGGVIGGVAEVYGVDSAMLRLLWVIITVFTGVVPGILIYVAALFIIPQEGAGTPGAQ